MKTFAHEEKDTTFRIGATVRVKIAHKYNFTDIGSEGILKRRIDLGSAEPPEWEVKFYKLTGNKHRRICDKNMIWEMEESDLEVI